MLRILVAIVLLTSSAALAQQQTGGPDPAFLGSAIQALQQQRNQALDQAANAQAQLALMQQELQKTQNDLAALKKEQPSAPKPKDH